MKRIFIIILTTLMVASCFEGKYYESTELYISFDLPSDSNVFKEGEEIHSGSFSYGPLYFYSRINEDEEKTFRGGFALGRYADTLSTEPKTYSPYKFCGKPAGDGKVDNYFVLFHDDPDTSFVPKVSLSYLYGSIGSIAPKSLKVNNTAEMVAISFGQVEGIQLVQGDWLKLVITGYDVNENSTGSVTVMLMDYSGAEKKTVTTWTEVDISALGDFDYAMVKVLSNREDLPRNVCIDNINATVTVGSK